jgi:hypothetical protein
VVSVPTPSILPRREGRHVGPDCPADNGCVTAQTGLDQRATPTGIRGLVPLAWSWFGLHRSAIGGASGTGPRPGASSGEVAGAGTGSGRCPGAGAWAYAGAGMGTWVRSGAEARAAIASSKTSASDILTSEVDKASEVRVALPAPNAPTSQWMPSTIHITPPVKPGRAVQSWFGLICPHLPNCSRRPPYFDDLTGRFAWATETPSIEGPRSLEWKRGRTV